jgi:thiol-disulfide isomerase/thioredoxin
MTTFSRMCRPRIVLTAAAVLALPLAGCGVAGDGAVTEGGATPAGPALAGELAPDFELQDLDGNLFRLSDRSGEVRLVDFWATWCAPCREEIPMFKELHEKYGDKGFTLVAVSMDDGPGIVREFIEDYEIPYVNLMGTDEVGEAFGGILGLPQAFLIDGDGQIVDKYVGAKPRSILEGKIRELLGMDSTASGATADPEHGEG